MDIKETERILEESAKKIKVRDFSEVWSEIKDKVEPAPKKIFYQKKWFKPLLAACFALIFAIALPIFLLNPPTTPEEIYYEDKLNVVFVERIEFFDGLEESNISNVDFVGYELSRYVLYKTENDLVKGGSVDLNNLSTYIKIRFYDKSVKIDDLQEDIKYENTYTNDGLTALYNIGEGYPDYNIYSYNIFASYNNVNYFIEYTGTASNPVDFFNSFFK